MTFIACNLNWIDLKIQIELNWIELKLNWQKNGMQICESGMQISKISERTYFSAFKKNETPKYLGVLSFRVAYLNKKFGCWLGYQYQYQYQTFFLGVLIIWFLKIKKIFFLYFFFIS